MSRVFIESFFPAVTGLLQRHTNLFERTFPEDVALQCPEITISILSTQIRNPVLLIQAVLGLIIGWGGGKMATSQAIWSLSFWQYGWMNAVALPLHCFLPQTESMSDKTRPEPWLWMLDLYFTGASSVAIMIACRREYWHRVFRCNSGSVTEMQEWCLWNTVGVYSVVVYLLFDMTLPLELWYLVPTLAAGNALLPLLVLDVFAENKSPIPLAACGTAAAMVVGILAFDAVFCNRGIELADTFTAPTVAFTASNLAFAGVLYRLQEEQEDKQKRQ